MEMVVLVVLVVVAALVAVVGLRVGMLLAPRVGRWGTPPGPDHEIAAAARLQTGTHPAVPAAARNEDSSAHDRP